MGGYGVGLAFLPTDEQHRANALRSISQIANEEQLEVLGWREVPVDPSSIGASAKAVMPYFAHVFIASKSGLTEIELDRKLFIVRKRIEHVFSFAVFAHSHLQGHAHHSSAGFILPRVE
jgi:glutamate synthase (NADPH/NADH) large chain